MSNPGRARHVSRCPEHAWLRIEARDRRQEPRDTIPAQDQDRLGVVAGLGPLQGEGGIIVVELLARVVEEIVREAAAAVEDQDRRVDNLVGVGRSDLPICVR
jgi:hypothetical protein